MNAAQALLREVRRDRDAWWFLDDDLKDAIIEELKRADTTPPDDATARAGAGPRILPITAYRATHPTPTGVEPDSPRGRYTYPSPDPRLRGLRFEAEEG